MKRRIYLTLERGRDVALRNLLRKVFVAGGFDEPKEGETTPVRRTRVPVVEFQAAISMGSGGDIIDSDEVECLLANMIYKVRATQSVYFRLPRSSSSPGASSLLALVPHLKPPTSGRMCNPYNHDYHVTAHHFAPI